MWKKALYTFAILALAVVGTVIVSRNKHLTLYEAAASVYPLQMGCATSSCTTHGKESDSIMATINPCYRYKRILASDDFRNTVIEHARGELDEKNYDRRVLFHETHDHQIRIQLFLDDSAKAVNLITYIVEEAEYNYNQCLSTQIEQNSCWREARVRDYMTLEKQCSHLRLADEQAERCNDRWLTISDMVSSPHIVRAPSTKKIVLYGLLSLLFSIVVCESIRQCMGYRLWVMERLWIMDFLNVTKFHR